jgi:hypothetical protein
MLRLLTCYQSVAPTGLDFVARGTGLPICRPLRGWSPLPVRGLVSRPTAFGNKNGSKNFIISIYYRQMTDLINDYCCAKKLSKPQPAGAAEW